MPKSHQAIVIASLQHRRQSLVAMLRSMPEMGQICECETVDNLEKNPEFHPSLIIFDCWLDDKITLDQICPTRQLFPGAHCLALVKQNGSQVDFSYADTTLSEGFSIHQFFQSIRDLLNNHKTPPVES